MLKFNKKKPDNSIKKRARDMNKHFTKEDMQLPDKHKKFSISLVIREIQSKTTMRYQ